MREALLLALLLPASSLAATGPDALSARVLIREAEAQARVRDFIFDRLGRAVDQPRRRGHGDGRDLRR